MNRKGGNHFASFQPRAEEQRNMAETRQSTLVEASTPPPALPPQDGLLVEQLAAILGETTRRVHTQIQRIVTMLGAEVAEQLANQAYVLHAGVGLLTLDGKQQRTLGGIFLRLAKEQATDQQRVLIFPQLAYRPGVGQGQRSRATPSPQAEAPAKAGAATSEPEVPFEQFAGEMQEWATGAASIVCRLKGSSAL
jgi:hypothetical protein